MEMYLKCKKSRQGKPKLSSPDRPSIYLSAIDDIVSSRSVGNHRDRIPNLLFYELDILPAVLGQFLISLNPPDVTFPSCKLLIDRLRLLKQMGNREF